MRFSLRNLGPLASCTLMSVALVLACEGSDESPSGTGGKAGSGGKGGTGGKGGGGGTGGNAGTSGTGGKGGTGGASGTGGAGSGGTSGAAGAAGQAGMAGAGGALPCGDAGALVPPTVVAALEPPTGATLQSRFSAKGTQIYTCTATPPTADAGDAGTTYAWTLKAPAADLFDDECVLAGTHFAGPTWKSSVDNSEVVGARVASDPAPIAGAIPWLLVRATSNTGTGTFANVTAIQRVDTTGGVAPATGCSAATATNEQAIAYTANYYFYTGGSWDGG